MRGQDVFTRFWNKVNKTESCWNWIGAINGSGYGDFVLRCVKYKSKIIRPHRFSYQIHFGKIPYKMLVCHKCDNPLCVNPGHLFLGKDSDNNRDRALKGRSAVGLNHGTKTHPESIARGERASFSKLKESEVIKIRKMYKSGECSYQSIASIFGVCWTTIRAIVKRKTWVHI